MLLTGPRRRMRGLIVRAGRTAGGIASMYVCVSAALHRGCRGLPLAVEVWPIRADELRMLEGTYLL
jgi:hypothetical protein